MAGLGAPGILKIAQPRYPGHGRHAVANLEEAAEAFREMGEQPCILEERLYVEKRLSVILARSIEGEIAVYPVVENRYRKGILDLSLAPADISTVAADGAIELACELADELEYCGVLSIEFFLTGEGELLVNDITPRPHNSGHYTVDACVTSQFEQQVRMMCGLPPGDTQLLTSVVMTNLLGDLWSRGDPDWEPVFHEPQAKLHLYGKQEARPGRKMGHINCLAEDTEGALEIAESIRKQLMP
jgi:5-(carboxyamino)imidazole ribonucleotide synthase